MNDQEAIAMIGLKKIKKMTRVRNHKKLKDNIKITFYAIMVTILAGTIIVFSIMWESVIK